MTTETLLNNAEITIEDDAMLNRLDRFTAWVKHKLRKRKIDEYSAMLSTAEAKSEFPIERATAGVTTAGDLAGKISKIAPRNSHQHISLRTTAPEAIAAAVITAAVMGPLYKVKDERTAQTFNQAKAGLETGVALAVGVVALTAHVLGVGTETTGLLDAAGFVGGAVLGAVVLPKVCQRFTKNDPAFFKRIDNGFAWGALLGGVVGGLIGTLIPGVGPVMGSLFGAGLGSAIGGSSAAALPILHPYFKSEKLKLFAKTGSVVGAAVGAAIGSLMPGLGTVIGAAAGACLGAVVGICAYKAYKSIKKIVNTVNETKSTLSDNSTETQADTKEKNKALVNELKMAVTIGSLAGAAIGSIIPGIGTAIGAGVGTVIAFAWVGFRKVTEGTKVGIAIDNSINKVVNFAMKIKNTVVEKLTSIFSPAPKYVELEDFSAADDKSDSYSALLETLVIEKQIKAAQKPPVGPEPAFESSQVIKHAMAVAVKPVNDSVNCAKHPFWDSNSHADEVYHGEIPIKEFTSDVGTTVPVLKSGSVA